MSDFYDSIASTAKTLIADKGQLLTITRSGVATHNPVTGEVTNSTSTGSVYAVALPLSSSNDDRRFLDSVKCKKSVKFLIAALDADLIPDEGDRIAYNSDSWEICSLTKLSPAGTDLIYKCYGVV